MDNYSIAWYLRQIATLLELQGVEDYRVIAYKKAAQTLEGLQESIRDMPKNKRAQLPAIGPKMAAMIDEYLKTGSIEKYNQALAKTPPEFLTMLKINGMGPKSIRLLHKHLGITTLQELEAAVKARKVRNLPGIGAKFEMKLATGIHHLTTPPTEFALGSVLAIARAVVEVFQQQPIIDRAILAGDIRRMKDTIEQVDIVISCEEIEKVKAAIKSLPDVHRLISETEHVLILSLEYNVFLPFCFTITKPKNFVCTLHEQTGTKEYLHFIGQIANEKKVDLKRNWESEEQLLEALELPYVPPELREVAFLDRIKKNTLPKLVELSDIKGDLHMHSRYSDGVHSIEEMANTAKELGYEYIAITDHSQSLKIAKGLTMETWRKQKQEITVLNNKLEGIHIFSGTEMDILTDTTLDFEEEFLRDVDVVVASIHTGFQQDKTQQTNKFLSALKSPFVDILAHPTGRLIAKRAGYELDLDQIFQKAKAMGTCIEINSSPDRLDLNAENARKAVTEYGLMICINTDAHAKQSLTDMELGVSVARRAGLEAKDILNTRSKRELMDYIRRNHEE